MRSPCPSRGHPIQRGLDGEQIAHLSTDHLSLLKSRAHRVGDIRFRRHRGTPGNLMGHLYIESSV